MIRMLFLALALMSIKCNAAQFCSADDTRQSCLDKVQAAMAEEDAVADQDIASASQLAEEGAALVALQNTGSGNAAGGGGTTNDFLPLLRAILNTGDRPDDGQQVGVEWSNPLGLPARYQNKLTVAFVQSDVYAPLKDALRSTSHSDQIEAVKDDVSQRDDISVGFSYAPGSKWMGRDPELHADLFSALLKIADLPAQDVMQAMKARVDLEKELGLPSPYQGKFNEISQLKGLKDRAEIQEKQQALLDAVEAEHLAQFASLTALHDRLTKNGFYGLVDLINNQPQLSITALYRDRSEAVGPDEFQANISYELGWNNVNTFREFAGSCKAAEILCLAEFLSRPDVIDGLKRSARISFALEYSSRKQLDFSIPEVGFSYAERARQSFRLSANYSRYLGPQTQARTKPRIEASLNYDDVSDDPLRQDRGFAKVALTYPVAQGFFLSIGAVYATKPEFRGDVDSEISARAGFTYKLLKD